MCAPACVCVCARAHVFRAWCDIVGGGGVQVLFLFVCVCVRCVGVSFRLTCALVCVCVCVSVVFDCVFVCAGMCLRGWPADVPPALTCLGGPGSCGDIRPSVLRKEKIQQRVCLNIVRALA